MFQDERIKYALDDYIYDILLKMLLIIIKRHGNTETNFFLYCRSTVVSPRINMTMKKIRSDCGFVLTYW